MANPHLATSVTLKDEERLKCVAFLRPVNVWVHWFLALHRVNTPNNQEYNTYIYLQKKWKKCWARQITIIKISITPVSQLPIQSLRSHTSTSTPQYSTPLSTYIVIRSCHNCFTLQRHLIYYLSFNIHQHRSNTDILIGSCSPKSTTTHCFTLPAYHHLSPWLFSYLPRCWFIV